MLFVVSERKMFYNFFKKVTHAEGNQTFYIKSTFFFLKAVGIASVNFKILWVDSTKKWRWTFTCSKIDIFYNVFLIALLILMNTIGISYMIKTDYAGRFKQDKFTIASFDTLIAFSVIFILTAYCSRQKKILFIMNKVSALRELSTESIENPVCYKSPSFGKITMLCLGHIVVTIIIIMLMSVTKDVYSTIYASSFNFCIFIIDIVLIQYSIILKLIKHFFQMINENLLYVTKKSLLPIDIQAISVPKLEMKLDHLMKLHHLVTVLSQDISNFYSLPMLFCTFNIFIDLLVCSYTVIKELIFSNNLYVANNILNLSHIYFNILSLSTLTINVTETIQEVSFIL